MESQASSRDGADFYVAGIGASAGGLDALERLFNTMPADTGIAFVVVQHLSPDFRSVMDELLARRTKMPVHRVEDGVQVEPNSIYVIPPKKEMVIADGRLLLTDKDRSRDLTMPIDVFLRSLAQDLGSRAIGIVLSGTGSDGSRGVREVHEEGGLVIVQQPATAGFDGMPNSALDTGVVDLVLPPEGMPEALCKYVSSIRPAAPLEEPSGAGMRLILESLRAEFGIDFAHYKPNTVARRVERRVLLREAGGLEEYASKLRDDPEELNTLYRDLLIGVTGFFRDRDAFRRLETDVFPELVDRFSDNDELRGWVAGCATGEEAYSLAMVVHDALLRAGKRTKVKIFATDVHRTSLDLASLGVYSESAVAEIPAKYRERYFTRKGRQYQVVHDIRQMVVFAPHNVVRDAPFTRLDFVSCRNLLIYLRPLAQRKALSLFLFGLRRDGILFLGPSENVGSIADDVEGIDDRWKIFRKHRDGALPAEIRFGLARTHRNARDDGDITLPMTRMMRVYDQLLAEHMPPSILITEDRELVHAFGGASQLLRVRDGRPTFDILELVDAELRMPLTGAIQRARKQREPVVFTGIQLHSLPGRHRLIVKPVGAEGEALHLLVSLDPMDPPDTPVPEREGIDIGEMSREQIAQLEEELRHTKENLQAMVEELETSNEELQATNEELVASNEELQSTNEELQSVNEELYTVNAEFQKKIQELTQLTSDMDNFLSATDVGTIFLDRDLCIRKFTRRIADTFSLIEQDVGRPIESFAHNIEYRDLGGDVRQVIRTGRSVEREVRSYDDRWFYLRLLPYRTIDGTIDGAVLTLIDVSALKGAEEALREAVRRRDEFMAMLSHELRNPLAALLNAAQLLEARQPDNPPVQVLLRQTSHMARLLDDLLDVSRVTRNQIEIQRDILDLRSVVDDAVQAARAAIDKGGLSLERDIGDAPVWVDGDAVRLQQVLVNLLNNAAKYNREGGTIWLAVGQDTGGAFMRVRDDGIGIDRRILPSIFEPFVQAERELSRTDGGMGLGLTLVRAIVELHGGTTYAHSDGLGTGTELVVRLPSCAPPEARRATVASPPTRRAGNILIVEDSEDHRETLRELLELSGYQVVTAADGQRAIAAIEATPPEIALVDIGLPELDGYELARRVRSQFGSRLRLIALTGYGSAADRRAALESGFDDHVVKPIETEALLRILARFSDE